MNFNFRVTFNIKLKVKWIVSLDNPSRDRKASVTITNLDGISKVTPDTKPGEAYSVEQKVVKGPWKFEVELPGG